MLDSFKKPNGKVLRVWPKKQGNFEIFVKIFEFPSEKLVGKLIFPI